ncbi:MAG: ABC transporter ATP-binding protein [Rhodopseudomonas sp.]|uniref:ABC transporter ATP-binding protein n=1 Tax=Rhodopseudomonas sp. TaxID=1078 RepID=UPI0039E2F1C9
MHSVDIRSVSKSFGTMRAVDDVSFSVERGHLLVLLGPSGCGKSTLLRMIAGLEDPDAGVVAIEGRDVRGLTGAARGVGMVFQSYALFPHLTVADNITFGLSVRGVPKRDIAQRLDRIVSLLGLEPLLKRKPSQLSGGQQQRVALGRALIAEAPVCLLDEPLSNLDAQLRLELRREIRALQQRLGITMIYVTHDQSEAMSMADRVILMRSGQIEQHGTPAQLYEQPASLFTAGFIGATPMNLLDLDDGPHGAVVAEADGHAVFEGPGRGRVLGLRPEDVSVHSINGPNRFHATVTSVEYLGAEAVVTCAIGQRSLQARTRGDGAPPVGARVGLGWDAAAGHVFDAESGRRLSIQTGTVSRPLQLRTATNQESNCA